MYTYLKIQVIYIKYIQLLKCGSYLNKVLGFFKILLPYPGQSVTHTGVLKEVIKYFLTDLAISLNLLQNLSCLTMKN